MLAEIPAAIAGVMRSDLWTRPKLYQRHQTATAAHWLSHFLLKHSSTVVKGRSEYGFGRRQQHITYRRLAAHA